jgi:hypothetical protein
MGDKYHFNNSCEVKIIIKRINNYYLLRIINNYDLWQQLLKALPTVYYQRKELSQRLFNNGSYTKSLWKMEGGI